MNNNDLQKLCVSRISNATDDSGLYAVALAILLVMHRIEDVSDEICRIANAIERRTPD